MSRQLRRHLAGIGEGERRGGANVANECAESEKWDGTLPDATMGEMLFGAGWVVFGYSTSSGH